MGALLDTGGDVWLPACLCAVYHWRLHAGHFLQGPFVGGSPRFVSVRLDSLFGCRGKFGLGRPWSAHAGAGRKKCYNMILTLERRGLITRTPGQGRFIEALVPRDQLPALD